jgi:hypothetical protein
MPYAVCPACEEETYVSARLLEGDSVRCRNCREQLEVIDTDPYELDWPYDEAEDWDEASDSSAEGESWTAPDDDSDDDDDEDEDDDELLEENEDEATASQRKRRVS